MLALLGIVIGLVWLAQLTGKVRRLEARLAMLEPYEVDPVPAYEPAPPPVAPVARIVDPPVETVVPPTWVEEEDPAEAVVAPPARSLFEDLFGGRLPIWAGGITLAVAAVFLVRYSIENGLLPPGARVVAGLLFGFALVGGGEAARRWRATAGDPRISQALAGAGIAALYSSLLAGIRIYDLIGPFPGFLGLAAVTGAAMLLALRFGAPCAVLGLVGGLAAPALVGASEPNVPGMAFYLMLVIGGLSGIARRKGWLWLAASALIGGFGWAALLLLGAIDTASVSATGALLLMLAIGLPILAGDIAHGGIVRLASLAVGAIEIAALVARGGYAPLEWGLYGLLGIGAVILARLDRRQAAMPPIALAIALGTAMAWPAPSGGLLTAVLGGIVAIFAAPALIDARHADRGRLAAFQGAAALCLVPLVGWTKLPALLGDGGWALLCLGFALAAAAAARSVWKAIDERFAALASASAALVTAASVLALPHEALPPALAVVACVSLWVAHEGADRWLGRTSRLIGLLIPIAILMHLLFDVATPWFDLALIAAACGVAGAGHIERSEARALPWLVAAPMMIALALHHQLSPSLLAASLAGAATLLAFVPRRDRLRPVPSALSFAAMATLLVAAQIGRWLLAEAPVLVGGSADLALLPTLADAVMRLAIPGGLLAVTVMRIAPAGTARRGLLAGAAAVVGIALHIIYRHGFAQIGMSGGAPERILLTTLLIAAGMPALSRPRRQEWRRAAMALLALGIARAIWFEMLVCNPLVQTWWIGALPILNWLAPAYLLPAAILLAVRREPIAARFSRAIDAVVMLLLLQFVAASVRQLFHGAILSEGGVTSGENVMWSLAGIGTAIAFLVHGLRQNSKDWRIAGPVLMIATVLKVFLIDAAGLDGLLRILSFVALGFSLIGIGWLHRRLSGEPPTAMG